MALTTVAAGGQVMATDINQLVNVLKQPGSSTEAGRYFLRGQAYTNGATIACYIPSLSRTTVPVSVAIDEADHAHSGALNVAVLTVFLTNGGFQYYCTNTNGPTQDGQGGGNYTITY